MPHKYKRLPGSRRYQQYDEDSLAKAVHAVKVKKMTLRKASEEFGVPISTISEHSNNKHPGQYGGQKVLSDEEEERLVKTLLTCAEWGQPLTGFDIRLVIQSYLNRLGIREKRFNNNVPGRDWLVAFLRRNKILTTRLCENIKRGRAEVSEEVLTEYYQNLEKNVEGVTNV